MTLFSLAEGIRKCTACPLWKKRTLAIPGEGNSKAKIMVVGEAPDGEEDRQGRLFIGKSGKFLEPLLKDAGIKRKDVFITNCVKCHPPQNRNPTVKELKTCRELWLEKQIELIKPKLIVVLGIVALRSLLNKNNVEELHGKLVQRKYFITHHPAAGLRFSKIKKEMEKDFKRLKKLIT